jgi:uridine phosphorylase
MEKPPLLDFDPERPALIEPSERFPAGRLPERALLSFFPEALEALCAREKAESVGRLESLGLHPEVWRIERDGKGVVLFLSGVGAPAAGAFLEELIALGVRKAVVCGGAGVLERDIVQGHILLPIEAVREEGLSYHYLPAGLAARPGAQALAALRAVLARRRVPYREVKTWTTDGLYRETRGKIARRRAEGCFSVEMEAAALFAVAEFRGIQLAQLLYAGDAVGGARWDQRGWTKNLSVQEQLLELGLEAVLSL